MNKFLQSKVNRICITTFSVLAIVLVSFLVLKFNKTSYALPNTESAVIVDAQDMALNGLYSQFTLPNKSDFYYVKSNSLSAMQYNEHRYAYCLNYGMNYPANGAVMWTAFNNEITDKGLIYIANHGTDSQYLVTTDNRFWTLNYYVAQAALWIYKDYDKIWASGDANCAVAGKSDPWIKMCEAVYNSSRQGDSNYFSSNVSGFSWNTNLASIFQTNTQSLINKAREEKTKSNTNYSISLGLLNTISTLTLDGNNNYVTEQIPVNRQNITTYYVNLTGAPEGTKIVGLSGTLYNSGDVLPTTENTIKISVPKSSVVETDTTTNKTVNSTISIGIEVLATASVDTAYEYTSSKAGDQNAIVGIRKAQTVRGNGNIKFTPPEEEPEENVIYKICKRINGTNTLLAGGSFQMYMVDGGSSSVQLFKRNWESRSDECFSVSNLPYNSSFYTIKEITAPNGYVSQTDKTLTITGVGDVITAEIDDETCEINGGGEHVCYIDNDPINLTISKRAATGTDELPGARLVLRDFDGNIIEEWTSTTEPHDIENVTQLEMGKTYTLEEITAPDGYEISKMITFELNNDLATTGQVIMRDNKIKEIKVPITSAVLSVFVYIIGGLMALCGVGLVYANIAKKED